MTDDLLRGLIRGGRLRAAINVGNKALVQQDGDQLRGVSPALAARLAESLGAELETVIYSSANEVVTDADSGRWDVAFLAVDPGRADRVTFADAYVTIETTYAVRAALDASGQSALTIPD
jgi:polar amino acid transport system substrate-binding protein